MPAPADPRLVVQTAARQLLESLPFLDRPVRVADAVAGVLVVVQITPRPTAFPLPTLAGERKARGPQKRAACKAAIAEALAGGPLTRQRLVNALRGRHSVSSIAKALAEMTAGGDLANPRDGLGYRLPGQPPAEGGATLFD